MHIDAFGAGFAGLQAIDGELAHHFEIDIQGAEWVFAFHGGGADAGEEADLLRALQTFGEQILMEAVGPVVIGTVNADAAIFFFQFADEGEALFGCARFANVFRAEGHANHLGGFDATFHRLVDVVIVVGGNEIDLLEAAAVKMRKGEERAAVKIWEDGGDEIERGLAVDHDHAFEAVAELGEHFVFPDVVEDDAFATVGMGGEKLREDVLLGGGRSVADGAVDIILHDERGIVNQEDAALVLGGAFGDAVHDLLQHDIPKLEARKHAGEGLHGIDEVTCFGGVETPVAVLPEHAFIGESHENPIGGGAGDFVGRGEFARGRKRGTGGPFAAFKLLANLLLDLDVFGGLLSHGG